jgi:hypothetical protein
VLTDSRWRWCATPSPSVRVVTGPETLARLPWRHCDSGPGKATASPYLLHRAQSVIMR